MSSHPTPLGALSSLVDSVPMPGGARAWSAGGDRGVLGTHTADDGPGFSASASRALLPAESDDASDYSDYTDATDDTHSERRAPPRSFSFGPSATRTAEAVPRLSASARGHSSAYTAAGDATDSGSDLSSTGYVAPAPIYRGWNRLPEHSSKSSLHSGGSGSPQPNGGGSARGSPVPGTFPRGLARRDGSTLDGHLEVEQPSSGMGSRNTSGWFGTGGSGRDLESTYAQAAASAKRGTAAMGSQAGSALSMANRVADESVDILPVFAPPVLRRWWDTEFVDPYEEHNFQRHWWRSKESRYRQGSIWFAGLVIFTGVIAIYNPYHQHDQYVERDQKSDNFRTAVGFFVGLIFVPMVAFLIFARRVGERVGARWASLAACVTYLVGGIGFFSFLTLCAPEPDMPDYPDHFLRACTYKHNQLMPLHSTIIILWSPLVMVYVFKAHWRHVGVACVGLVTAYFIMMVMHGPKSWGLMVFPDVMVTVFMTYEARKIELDARTMFTLLLSLRDRVAERDDAQARVVAAVERARKERDERIRADTRKESFESLLGYVCHEVLNPLQAILGIISLVRTSRGGAPFLDGAWGVGASSGNGSSSDGRDKDRDRSGHASDRGRANSAGGSTGGGSVGARGDSSADPTSLGDRGAGGGGGGGSRGSSSRSPASSPHPTSSPLGGATLAGATTLKARDVAAAMHAHVLRAHDSVGSAGGPGTSPTTSHASDVDTVGSATEGGATGAGRAAANRRRHTPPPPLPLPAAVAPERRGRSPSADAGGGPSVATTPPPPADKAGGSRGSSPHEFGTSSSAVGSSADDGHHSREMIRVQDLGLIEEAAHQMQLFTNDVLNHIALSRGSVTIKRAPTSVQAVLDGVARDFAHVHDGSILATIDSSVPAVVQEDPVRLKQLVAHGVANAVRFSAPGEAIRVHARIVTRLLPSSSEEDLRAGAEGSGDSGDARYDDNLVDRLAPRAEAPSAAARRAAYNGDRGHGRGRNLERGGDRGSTVGSGAAQASYAGGRRLGHQPSREIPVPGAGSRRASHGAGAASQRPTGTAGYSESDAYTDVVPRECLHVEVTNKGDGLRLAKGTDVADLFYPALSAGHMSLGLPICKMLVELLRGDIGLKEARDVPGGSDARAGSDAGATVTFWVDLPLTRLEGPPPTDMQSLSPGSQAVTMAARSMVVPAWRQMQRADAGRGASARRGRDYSAPSRSPLGSPPTSGVGDGGGGFDGAGAAGAASPSSASASTSTDTGRRGVSKRAPHVLFCDDEHVLRRLARRMLRSLGCPCTCVEDGDQVLAALEAAEARGEPVDVILLDINMRRMSGVDVCRMLRSMPHYSTLPIVAATANTSSHDLTRYKDAGFSSVVLGKPYSVERLREVLLSVCPITIVTALQ